MLTFEKTITSYCIAIEDDQLMLALEDSESYVTDNAAFADGNMTLCQKLDELDGVQDIDYNGHFGNHVFLSIEVDHDNAKTKRKISKVIEEHLAWCQTLEIVDHVKERRERENVAG
jgi:hypothetical protein